MGREWRKEEDLILVDLLYQEKSYQEIAKYLGRTIGAIRNRAYVTGNSRARVMTQKMIDKNRIWRNIATDN